MDDASGRYRVQQEEDGTWTVFDAKTPPGRENRIMAGVSEDRASQYAKRLNTPVRLSPSVPEEADERGPGS
jgi:hypothetical protein